MMLKAVGVRPERKDFRLDLVLEWLFFHVVFLLEWVAIERYGSKDLWFRLPPIYSRVRLSNRNLTS